MHVVFATRGPRHLVRDFIEQLSSTYLGMFWRHKKKDKPSKKFIRMRCCPVQLWDLSFPEEHKDVVCNTLFGGNTGESMNPKMKKFLWGLRKGLGVKKVEYKKNEKARNSNSCLYKHKND